MKKTIALGFAAALAAVSVAQAQDRVNIPPAEVPKEVVDLVKKFLPEGTITEATKRVRNNEDEYRLRVFVAGKIAEAEFDVEPGDAPEGSIEEPVAEADLPKAVAEAFRKAAPEAGPLKGRKVTDIDKDFPEGISTYEWKLKDPKRTLVISADGAEARVYQRVKEADLPASVREALAKDFPLVKIKDIDQVTVNGAVRFELEVDGGDDLVATPDGKIAVQDE